MKKVCENCAKNGVCRSACGDLFGFCAAYGTGKNSDIVGSAESTKGERIMTRSDRILFNLGTAAEFHYETMIQKRKQMDVYDSVEWYIRTGRAYVLWEKALDKANPYNLLKYVLKTDAETTEEQVKAVTKYLKRYCGLKL